MTIIIYTKANCIQCYATCRAMDRKGIDYQLVDLLEDREAVHHVKMLGYQQVPVIQTPNEHWSGFRPDKISLLSSNGRVV
ncbi:glutaredoxin-like protein NrdH [Candidatus Steffania adelgidicola]|uniref:glutaredoxin-like protein NrdH n=1 Tax=Candidatus Steffania adelgidicola TaxID=1076626 RepID=UPI001D01FF42|nr:glutaredoxin-like protein NrdH [Candidatus Steffania adelgidicola]UDG79525.1 Glutaredoxin-like protein NrdH [Candidatus Steffania adelgidicola]